MLIPLLADSAGAHGGWLTNTLLQFARGGAEWVLWLLVILGFVSVFIFFERLLFLKKHAVDAEAIRQMLLRTLGDNDVDTAVNELSKYDAIEAHVTAYGLREAERGPEAVVELCRGAAGIERLRYERGLSVLATIGSNAPFIGLFGTVMGVIMAFDQLRELGGQSADGSGAVMGAIAEALIATGVGLLVAIPAILFYNLLKSRVKKTISTTQLLVDTAVAMLRSQRGS
ncbi:MAG: biopolymer transport protein ExbB/TolQ [Bradymonadia bacterium]|jgi:biopolymer transport protein ExbB/TolQ